MRSSSPYQAYPPQPPGVAEWEDLLVRFELGPRIAASVLEDIPRDRWNTAADGRSPCEHLAHLASRERALAGWLDAMRSGARLEWAEDQPVPGDAAAQLDRFARLRSRNSGAVQRRGVDVWAWAAPHPDGGTVGVYQALSVAVRHDGRHIAAMRAAC